ncbi:hypothetical protein ACIRSD_45045 [Streptomyces acidicola]|uniref:hypothetical protein n=1 Tax=Streptomyces acidicola TaxID=2596892 RepID=UPI003800954E
MYRDADDRLDRAHRRRPDGRGDVQVSRRAGDSRQVVFVVHADARLGQATGRGLDDE